MLTKAAVLLLAVAAILCLFTFHIARRSAKLLDEITQLRHTNAALQKRADDVEALMRQLNRLEAQMNEAEIKDVAATRAPLCTPAHPKLSTITTSTATSAAATNSTADDMSAATLLSVHSTWDWRSIVDNYLRPWPTISYEQLDSAVAACNGSAMYCQRFQVHDGKLYITDYAAIFFDRHYAPARVLPLLDTLRRHPQLRNLDIVVAGNDEPRVHNVPGDPRLWRRSCQRYCGDGSSTSVGRAPPALFSSTTNRATLDLPWLDFAWFFPKRPHKLRTPPWSVLHPQLLAAGRSVPWATKVELAMHTGNVGSAQRKLLAAVAQGSPDTMLVNELFIGDHNTIRKRCVELGLHRTGGYQKHRCFMTFEDQCSYKYLLNSASIGYANKFKSLLLCGSVVLYVRDGMRHQEFYEHGLLAGVHYVAVDRASDVPAMVRWPGVVKPGTVCNDIVSHLDWLPTIVEAAGDPGIKEKLLKGHTVGKKTFKVHLDGHSLMPYFTGKTKNHARKGFLYFTDDGDLACLRYDNWKFVFMEQRVAGTMQVWAEPLTPLRVPKLFNLRTDPYERADITSNTYYDWLLDRAYMFVPAQALVAEFLSTFKDYPPRQKAASFSVDQVMEKMTDAAGGGHR